MRAHSSSAVVLAAFASAVVTSWPVAAAPDNTLGVALMSARVDSDGTTLASSGATGVTHPGGGQYVVEFDRDVASCIYSVKPFNNLRGASVLPAAASGSAVAVTIWGISGISFAPTDGEFDLIVYCGG